MWRIVLALLLVALAPGCGGARGTGEQREPIRACTDVGCGSGVQVGFPTPGHLWPRAARATVCVDERCERVRLRGRFGPPNGVMVNSAATGPRTVHIRVVIRDSHGQRLLRAERRATLARLQPNGPHCPPTCWFAAVRLDAHGRLVEA